MKPCKTCMKWRARFLLWLGTMLGVMRPEEQKESPRMEMNMDIAMAIIGTKECELVLLRQRIAQLEERLKQFSPKPDLKSVGDGR